MFFFVIYDLIIQNSILQKSDFLEKYYILIILVDFYVYHNFFYYPYPDPRFRKWIRIRPKDTDPTGSGSDANTTYFLKMVPPATCVLWGRWIVLIKIVDTERTVFMTPAVVPCMYV